MAKKADLLEEAKQLGLKVTTRNTIAQIEEAIAGLKVTPSTETETSSESQAKPEREVAVAKAGKRSAKAQAEAEAKAEKEARKEAGDTAPQGDAPAAEAKGPAPKIRPKSERRGKKYREVYKLIDKDKIYSLSEAVELATKTSPSKFDASVEIHVRLGVDPRQADQNIRATVHLPHGTGRDVRVAVFAPESEHAAAKKAGADVVGDDSLLKQLDKDQIDFDVLVATPQYMPKLGKYARSLGPRGLMPNPKSGTVSADITKAVTDAKSGKVEYRVDKQAIVHLSIGKVSFGASKLQQNAEAFFNSLAAQKPASIKGNYVRSTTLTTTMGPGIKLESLA